MNNSKVGIQKEIFDLPFPMEWKSQLKIKPLFGFGQGKVFHLHSPSRELILKASQEPREYLFYKKVAPQIKTMGIEVPELLWSFYNEGVYWTALELIPNLLPEDQWRCNEGVLAKLSKLHDLKPEVSGIELKKYFWDESLALTVFMGASDYNRNMIKNLEDLRQNYEYLFSEKHFVSGDPNGRNWGRRANGELVLFDWERFGYGMPQLDLACVALGNCDQSVYENIAQVYLKYSQKSEDLGLFTKEIQVMRIYMHLELLSLNKRGDLELSNDLVKVLLEDILLLYRAIIS